MERKIGPMEISKIKYLGDLRTSAVHINSGESFITDAPLDNNGKGEAFSPTDLLSTSLGCCMFTLMGIAAEKHNFTFYGGEAVIGKEMLSSPRRVGKITVKIKLNGNYSETQLKVLETAALTCPVAKSLNPEINQEVSFEYLNS